MTDTTNTARIDIWIWVLVYAGLIVGGVGLAVQRGDPVLGWPVAIAGAVLIAAGALLIWIRSRMNVDKPSKSTP
ncbi:MAG: hypothetical protein ABI702_27030 [Burkholderiales bacterium]